MSMPGERSETGAATGKAFPSLDRIRPITPADPPRWLHAGWRDLRRAWRVSVPYGLIFVAIGYGLTAGLVLMLFLMIWVRVAALIFAVSFPYINATPQALVEALLSWNGLVFLLVGTAFGAVFAAAAFVFSALALPAMVDRRTDVFTGAALSAVGVLSRPRARAVWAALIVVLGGLGLATGLFGLAVALPLLGHATWHAYRATVAPEGE